MASGIRLGVSGGKLPKSDAKRKSSGQTGRGELTPHLEWIKPNAQDFLARAKHDIPEAGILKGQYFRVILSTTLLALLVWIMLAVLATWNLALTIAARKRLPKLIYYIYFSIRSYIMSIRCDR